MIAVVRTTALAAAALGLCAGVAVPAQAAYIVSLQQAGANVVATGSGSIDYSGLTFAGFFKADQARVSANAGTLVIGPTSTTGSDEYRPTSGPSSFGSGSNLSANIGSGAIVASGRGFLGVPVGYVSGTPLGTSNDTWTGATFASLGVTPGTFVWTWGTGANADSFSLQIGPASAPEPASLALLRWAWPASA
jgi:hypothetical protein